VADRTFAVHENDLDIAGATLRTWRERAFEIQHVALKRATRMPIVKRRKYNNFGGSDYV
jgi:hypothetical protein